MALRAGQRSCVRFLSSHETGLLAESSVKAQVIDYEFPFRFAFPRRCTTVVEKNVAHRCERASLDDPRGLHSIRIGFRDSKATSV